ncbi:MAG TPA: chromate transporter [Mycobacterium sp.]|nr:chromate transporter [Mycobacterium sp.]
MTGASPQNGHGYGPKWFEAFLGFPRIGATAFGGGSATIVAMRQLALRKSWLTEDEFLETILLSRVTPGITILAQVIVIGRRVDGTRGVLTALIGMLMPSITILLTRLYVALADRPWSRQPLAMVAAITAGFAVPAQSRNPTLHMGGSGIKPCW